MFTERLKLAGREIFVRHRILDNGMPRVLLIHGMGESGRCFFDAFGFLRNYSLIVPDLLGFGKSEKIKTDPEYSLQRQLEILGGIVDHFKLEDFVIVGHSYGGVLGTFMCRDDEAGRIKKFVNVEGCITRDTLVESSNAIKALKGYGYDMAEFGKWLHEGGFKKRVLEEFESASTIKYFDSVSECDPPAFAQTAIELVTRAEGEDADGNNEISTAYRDLRVRRIFCAGARPAMDSTKRYLTANGLALKEFGAVSHWVMLDNREEFYGFLDGYLRP